MHSTEAWVLHRAERAESPGPAELRRETFTFTDPTDEEVLAEPLYGCWEANMSHALERRPIDICRDRGEERVVIGNSGVVRVLRVGAAVKSVREGDVCVVFGSPVCDPSGYCVKSLAYDAPGTMGLLARRIKIHHSNLLPIPATTRHSYRHWAAFSVRYVTAWGNWKVAYGCWRVQMSEEDQPAPWIWAWGGGTALGELVLAQRLGWRAAMISSNDRRLELVKSLGIEAIDRRWFGNLNFDDARYKTDADYRARYQEAEATFLRIVEERTGGQGVSIFVDHIGAPVTRATLKALGRQGVITTAGWKAGMKMSSVRALECIARHIHVHTHYARYTEARQAMHTAETTNWVPPLTSGDPVYDWDDVPKLAENYASGATDSYFPLFQVNAV